MQAPPCLLDNTPGFLPTACLVRFLASGDIAQGGQKSGIAFVADPAEYRSSGVMTFILHLPCDVWDVLRGRGLDPWPGGTAT